MPPAAPPGYAKNPSFQCFCDDTRRWQTAQDSRVGLRSSLRDTLVGKTRANQKAGDCSPAF